MRRDKKMKQRIQYTKLLREKVIGPENLKKKRKKEAFSSLSTSFGVQFFERMIANLTLITKNL